MLVAFIRSEDGRRVGWTILAERGRRAELRGSEMAAGRPDKLPHDIGQFVVEATLGLEFGFWGCVAAGASFKSLRNRKWSKHGKAVLRDHLSDLDEAEGAANTNIGAWERGEATPLKAALDEALARWRATPDDQPLVLEWPSGRLVDRTGAVPQMGRGSA